MLGTEAEPLYVATRASVLWWIDHWIRTPDQHKVYRTVWHVIHPTVILEHDPEPNWASVFGPIGTTIANLHRVGWYCPSPDWWCDPQQNVWKLEP